MKVKTFDNGLVVKHRKSAVIFENEQGKKEREDKFIYEFTKDRFKELADYIEKAANESWSNVVPTEANSPASDYDEYYDRKYDDNGYLYIKENGILIIAPSWSVDTLYQFNKPKIQSFIYDLRKKLI